MKVKENTPCWKKFGLPAVQNEETNRFDIIQGFTSCKACKTTYKYKQGSTTSMNEHKCAMGVMNQRTLNFPTKQSSSSANSITFSTMSKTIERKKKVLTTLIAKWICFNVRPISIVEDEGFHAVIQECANTGILSSTLNFTELLPSRKTVSHEISRLANECRSALKNELLLAVKRSGLAISPDMWTDNFRKAIIKGLERYDLHNYLDYIQFVSDRGSNILKALEGYRLLNCFAHRLNNILKHTFYQIGKKKKQATIQSEEEREEPDDETVTTMHTSFDSDSNSDFSDDDVLISLADIRLKLLNSKSIETDYIAVRETKLNRASKQVLATIKSYDGRGGDGAESRRGDPRGADFSKLDEVRGDAEAGSLRGDPRDGAKDTPSPISATYQREQDQKLATDHPTYA
ncbi:unnamed protein product [Didymodactylos carnosus]|uniref:Transposase n=1 Tax=Didymodactylos carnosus TaxID=1234261 RepID=A0A813YBK1_9BILA|nr:unnamed protein product [Didymodactylos carnosus]CAF3667951.1 unnamed protein product [Didymodactylos carnosus]